MIMYQVMPSSNRTDNFNLATSLALYDLCDLAFNGGIQILMGCPKIIENIISEQSLPL